LTTITRAVGAILIVVGVVAYVVTDAASLTALAPAVVGLPILVLGLVAGRESLHRHAIHAALVVALLGLLGSVPMVVGLFADDAGAAEVTSTVTALLCAVYVALGVRSFVAARKVRESSVA
jgi:uncharacterized membrane protein